MNNLINLPAGRRLSPSRILVTGGAGFIGSNLVDALLAAGHRVVALDNFATGHRANLSDALHHPAFTLIEGDIRDYDCCRRAAEGADFILHEAALGSVPRSLADPVTSTEVNVTGFVNVLFAAVEARVKRVIYAASSSVYGDSPTLPKREEELGNPLSPYAVTKLADELFAANFQRVYGLPTIGLRYFNVFGRRQDPEGAYAAVIPKFILALLAHRAPRINGDGLHSRDFTYIDNVIAANLLALTAEADATGEVYNTAAGGRMTLRELFVELRAALAGNDPAIAAIEPEFGPVRAGDITHSFADIGKARTRLGYAPAVDASTGLRLTAAWYTAQRSVGGGINPAS